MLEMFKKREIKKTYLALVEGDLSREGEINVPINRSKYVFGKFAVSEEGKVAETSFKLLKKYYFNDKTYSLIEINLKTGRTHQIRVHFSYIGHPLLGDTLYGNSSNLIARQALHSYKINFIHPVAKHALSFEAPVPGDFIFN